MIRPSETGSSYLIEDEDKQQIGDHAAIFLLLSITYDRFKALPTVLCASQALTVLSGST